MEVEGETARSLPSLQKNESGISLWKKRQYSLPVVNIKDRVGVGLLNEWQSPLFIERKGAVGVEQTASSLLLLWNPASASGRNDSTRTYQG